MAYEKAKEAGRKERVLVRQREQLGVADQINLDLTYSVLFNLANRYAETEMYQEALNTYQVIVRNKMFAHAGACLSLLCAASESALNLSKGRGGSIVHLST